MNDRQPPARRPAQRPGSRPQAGARRPGTANSRPDRDRARRPPTRRPAGRRRSNDAARWVPVAAAGGLLAVVVGVGVLGGSGQSGAGVTTSSSLGSVASVATAPPSSYVSTATVATTAPIQKVALNRTIGDGMAGGDVEMIQQRLVELGFDPGPVDGIYGLMTKQSVWAFEKLILGTPREQASGQVTPAMWDRMQDPIAVVPRRSAAVAGQNHVEIYLPQQVMVVFHGDTARLVTHIASGELDANGEPKEYCETIRLDTDPNGVPLPEPVEKAICGKSKTPGGIFDVDRFVAGTRTGPLGSMWNPIYFNYGIAIHGARNVPLAPASHGCIRIPMHISEYTQELISKGDQVYVWNGKKEPEQQTRDDELPVFDYPDPNATTTTSTSTTVPATSTTVAATVAPSTTKPPATTVAPTTTTTVAPTTTVESTTTTTVEPADGL